MKRPEGFDPPKPEPAPAQKKKLKSKTQDTSGQGTRAQGTRAQGAKAPETRAPETKAPDAKIQGNGARGKKSEDKSAAARTRGSQLTPAGGEPARGAARARRPQLTRFAPPGIEQDPAPQTAVSPESRSTSSARQARKAARERRRFERDEVRRFTRRIRHRRLAWISAGAVVAMLFGTVAIAVYSPILALTTITITGTSSVDPQELHRAVEGQLGTPLALVNKDQLTRDLAKFTLIQSYVTEIVPPNTMIIHVTERKPIGALVLGSRFTVVDPAGVVIEKTDVRPPGVPTIEIDGAATDSEVFASVVEVLLALPSPLSEGLDRVTATTKDDVTLVLAGAGQRVVWGSAEKSELKARVLAKLMATQDPNARIEYDVTAPLNAVIRPI